jgi:uncharacterized membrane protein
MTDRTLENMVATLLRTGVTVAGIVVAIGGTIFLLRHGSEAADHHSFHMLPASDRLLGEILKGAFHDRGRSIIQTGILLLIATPIARVALSLIGFVMERDWKYVAMTALVLSVLLYSLISGAAHG